LPTQWAIATLQTLHLVDESLLLLICRISQGLILLQHSVTVSSQLVVFLLIESQLCC